MSSAPYDWSKFTRRITVNASIQDVYNAWSTQTQLENWFLRAAEFTKPDNSVRDAGSVVQPGDTYAWRWHGYGDEVTEHGRVLEANGKDLFKFIFGKAGVVTVKVITENGTTVCELTQSEIPTDEKSKATYHVGCSEGWTFYLANLKSILQGGIDLRNKDVKVSWVVNS